MYQEKFCSDSNGFSKTHLPNFNFSMDENSCPQNLIPSHQDIAAPVSAMEMELNLEPEQYSNNNTNDLLGNGGDQNLIQEIVNEMIHYNNVQYPPTNDLLNMFDIYPQPIPSSLLPTSSIPPQNISSNLLASLGLLGNYSLATDGSSPASVSGVYEPLLPLSLPPQPQPPVFRELVHSLPHGGYEGERGRNIGSLFGGVDEKGHVNDEIYQNGDVFEFSAEGILDFDGKNRDIKVSKSEKDRRVLMNDKYQTLRKLIPSPTKNDRASIVGDAIEYINKMKREVTKFKFLVEKKRCARERRKRTKTVNNNAATEGIDSNSLDDRVDNDDSSVRSSSLHRKSKNTEVDVRIIEDEVTVKLVQQKSINCLLLVSRVLDELQLDLHHVAGGLIGNYHSFLFNSKISEDCPIVHAGTIADKLIDVVDKQYSAVDQSTCSN